MTGVIKVDDIQDAGANSIVSSNGSGTLTLGSFTAPNITASTAILPDASDGAAIGSASLEWSDIFLADGAVINLGDDQDVTLTHVADTGIQLNSTNKLMFNDASQYIQGASATVLDIAATDEIELTATLVDINANVEISGTAVTTGVHTFTAVPVFPNNTVESADIQADAITGAKIADDAINSEHYTDGSIDTAHIADAQITTAKLATAVLTGATDIGADIADADLLLIDDGAGGTLRKTTAARIKTYIGAGTNTPAFSAKGTAATTMASNTATKITFGGENFDTDSKFADSRFTPTVAGKYYIEGRFRFGETTDITSLKIYIYKNGSEARVHQVSNTHNETVSVAGIIDLDSNDYVEIYGSHNHSGSSGTVDDSTTTTFLGFKLIT
jgi:hypothetical protein